MKRFRRAAGAALIGWLACAGGALGQTGATLTCGDLSGAGGDLLELTLVLANPEAVKGLQADLLFDPDALAVRGAAVTGRGTGMTLAWERVAAGRLRLVLFREDDSSLPAGSGPLVLVAVTLVGPGGTAGALTPGDLVLSDPEGAPLPITGVAGSLEILAATAPPVVEVAALPNPGRPRSLQILVTILDGSGAAPVVTADGEPVAMGALGAAVWLGRCDAGLAATGVTIEASDTNFQGIGTAQTLVSFDGEAGS